MDFEQKYLKYKEKYVALQKQYISAQGLSFNNSRQDLAIKSIT